MGEVMLTVKEVAGLKGCEAQSIRKLIERKTIRAEAIEIKGAGRQRGIQYRIPLTALDKQLQLKYKRRLRDAMKAEAATELASGEAGTEYALGTMPADAPEPEAVNYEALTKAEREQIAFWKGLLTEWREFRNSAPSKIEGDEQFVKLVQERWEKAPKRNSANSGPNAPIGGYADGLFAACGGSISVKTLYRKWNVLNTNGEGGLIDRRGKHEGHARKMTEEMRDIFEYYYLHKSQKTISLCMFLTGEELKRRFKAGLKRNDFGPERNDFGPTLGENGPERNDFGPERNGSVPDEYEPELPSAKTFERFANSIPIPALKWFREGVYAFMAECAPYIKRMYEDLEPNDIWVADGHTFDVMARGKDGKTIRLYLSAFMDVRTRKMMGWVVTDKLCGDATIYALKKGVEKYGVPKMILVDNGREYLFHDFSGDDAGFRRKAKKKDGEFKPPTILENLGIQIRTAIPKNARAKGIERAFETVKETFSKLFDGYTGGNVLEKPDDLKYTVKQPGKLPTAQELTEYVEKYITGFYNKQPHRGEGMNGKSPDEVYAEQFYEKRVVPADMLNLMFMRYGKGTMKVGKNGVTLKVYGAELQYSTPELWREYFGREVYVRYSPDDLASVRVYDTDNRFICEAKLETKLSYNASKEAVQNEQRKKRSQVKTVTTYKNMKNTEAQSALDAMLNAAANLTDSEEPDAKVVRMLKGRSEEREPESILKAAGAEGLEPIDWTSALEKLKEQKKEVNYE